MTEQLAQLIGQRALHLCRAWTLTRCDGLTARLTDHNRTLRIGGAVYLPGASISTSALRREDALQDVDVEVSGPLSPVVTLTDLHAGRWRGATVDEQVVDWRYPWLGAVAGTSYVLGQTRCDGECWSGRLVGLTHHLKAPLGSCCTRNCRHTFGDAHCGIDLAAHTFADTVAAVTSRRVFTLSTQAHEDDHFRYGRVLWLTGANAGLQSEVAHWEQATKQVTLQLPAPDAVQPGDTLNIVAGCDLNPGTCAARFDNFDRFGGFPFMPGTDDLLENR